MRRPRQRARTGARRSPTTMRKRSQAKLAERRERQRARASNADGRPERRADAAPLRAEADRLGAYACQLANVSVDLLQQKVAVSRRCARGRAPAPRARRAAR